MNLADQQKELLKISDLCETTSSNLLSHLPPRLSTFIPKHQNTKQTRTRNLPRILVPVQVYLHTLALIIKDHCIPTYFTRFVALRLQSNQMTLLSCRGMCDWRRQRPMWKELTGTTGSGLLIPFEIQNVS
jgi:hypothetical protein